MPEDKKIRSVRPELADHLDSINLPYWKHNRRVLRRMSIELIGKINRVVWEAREGHYFIDEHEKDIVNGMELLLDQASLVSVELAERKAVDKTWNESEDDK